MEPTTATLTGSGRFRSVSRFGFPTEELIGDDGLIAQFGRDGSMRIFFGKGRRVRLADGTEWRIKAVEEGRHIVPMIRSAAGLVAIPNRYMHSAVEMISLDDVDHAAELLAAWAAGLTGAEDFTP